MRSLKLWHLVFAMSLHLLICSIFLKDRETAILFAFGSGGLFSFSGQLRRIGRKKEATHA